MEKFIFTDYVPEGVDLTNLSSTSLKERFIAVFGEEEFNRLANKDFTEEDLRVIAEKLNIKIPSTFAAQSHPTAYAEDLDNKDNKK